MTLLFHNVCRWQKKINLLRMTKELFFSVLQYSQGEEGPVLWPVSIMTNTLHFMLKVWWRNVLIQNISFTESSWAMFLKIIWCHGRTTKKAELESSLPSYICSSLKHGRVHPELCRLFSSLRVHTCEISTLVVFLSNPRLILTLK